MSSNKKIAFFDIDGTLTSEIDGSIPQSTRDAIKQARANGHLMFINTGRCMQNIEKNFLDIGFDGVVAGCGTNIYGENYKELFYLKPSREITKEILHHSRKFNLDIIFESRLYVQFDNTRPILSKAARELYNKFVERKYDLTMDVDSEDFTCDKFVVWFESESDIDEFRKVSDKYFDCIDRGENFREFVPIGFSKATGIQYILDLYNLPLENAYALGDSNNDLAMLDYVPHSIAMGNAESESLFATVSYVTAKSSENGIEQALRHFGFI
jgi:hypothetical protein